MTWQLSEYTCSTHISAFLQHLGLLWAWCCLQGSCQARTSILLGLWTWEEPQPRSRSCHGLRWAVGSECVGWDCMNWRALSTAVLSDASLSPVAQAEHLWYTEHLYFCSLWHQQLADRRLPTKEPRLQGNKKKASKWVNPKRNSHCFLDPGWESRFYFVFSKCRTFPGSILTY